jgi:putative acetyltransferase
MMIRLYQQQDLESLLAVWESASKIAHSFLDESFFVQERSAIIEQYLPIAQTWVYEEDRKVVGFISLINKTVGGLFVKPSRQGQGIGKALMNQGVRLRGKLEVDVFELNSIGRNFYQKYGFVEVEESIHPKTGFTLIRMTLN